MLSARYILKFVGAILRYTLERGRNPGHKMKNTKVYLMSIDNVKDPKTFISWQEFLPKERWEKTVRPVKEEDRKTELAAWLLLYHALKEWGVPEERINVEGVYCYGEHGKPMRSDGEVYFNLSHSGKYVLCSISETEIGCDIEKVKEVKWKIAKRFFSEKEYDFLEKLEEQKKLIKQEKTDRQEKTGKQQNIDKQKEQEEIEGNVYTVEAAFTRFWVLRESYVKKTGEGLGVTLEGLDFSDISAESVFQTRSKGRKNGEFLKENFFEIEYDGYCIAVCEEKGSKPEFIVYRL